MISTTSVKPDLRDTLSSDSPTCDSSTAVYVLREASSARLLDSVADVAQWLWPRLVGHFEFRQFDGWLRHPVLTAIARHRPRTSG